MIERRKSEEKNEPRNELTLNFLFEISFNDTHLCFSFCHFTREFSSQFISCVILQSSADNLHGK